MSVANSDPVTVLVLFGTFRYIQVLSGIIRYFQVLSGTFRYFRYIFISYTEPLSQSDLQTLKISIDLLHLMIM